MRPVPLLEARWPDHATASRALLFQPIRLGPLTSATRTWVPAMVPWRATEDGFVTEANLAWYRRFAWGRPGVLVAEATGIRDVASGPLLRIGHARFLPGLTRLTEAVRAASEGQTRFFVQLIDFLTVRRRPTPEAFFGRHLALTPTLRERLAEATGALAWRDAPEAEVRAWLLAQPDAVREPLLAPRDLESYRYGYRERVTDLHLPHVRDLPRVLPGLFADAAERAREAGFDGVELHFAHAYTMASFLSRTNDRDDGYGGSTSGRLRLALEVIAAVRARVGAGFCVGTRFLGDEVIEGGSRLADAAAYAIEFARAGLDFLSLSKGGRFEDAKQPRVGEAVYPYTGPSGHECMPTVRIDAQGPFGRNVPLASGVRAAVRAAGFSTPVVAAGGIATFEQAEQVLRDGHADLVASARQSLADPDWWTKMREGRGAEIRRCEFTNYCEGLDQAHKQVTCKLWDKPEPGLPPHELSHDGRRRLLPP
jgi:2,4-dienoyl-CoA reductase-like NADH-dependent reductase (Old Yellow Enzyme family)